MKDSSHKTIIAVLLHSFVIVARLTFIIMQRVNPRFRKAISSFEAVYQFRAGSSVRRLIFKNGRLKTRRGTCITPDYEVIFIDLPGALRKILNEPNNLLQLLMENKIDQVGNNYYLFKFGYLCGLCERQLRDLAARFQPLRSSARDVN